LKIGVINVATRFSLKTIREACGSLRVPSSIISLSESFPRVKLAWLTFTHDWLEVSPGSKISAWANVLVMIYRFIALTLVHKTPPISFYPGISLGMAAVSSSDDSSIRRKRQRAEQKQPKQRQDPDPTFQESSGIQPKVAIPRIQQDDNRARKRRIKHACVACQQQKAKCSGGQPRCQRCSDLDLECCYSMGKRAIHRQYARLVSRAQARLINRMHERLEEQNNQAWGLLSLLRSNASPEDQQLIQKHLDLVYFRSTIMQL